MAFYPTTTDTYTLYPSAVRFATAPTPAEFSADGRKNVRVDINFVGLAGTSVTFKIQGYDVAANQWYDLLSGTAISSTSRAVLQIGPDLVSAANTALNAVLPARMRLFVTHTAITQTTYSATITKSY